ncbi:universal stress protein [Pseudooceanicola sediminis]|uniref:Universal stress protein n=1 Tax=Pseudooceanicola sediminis TaxID=2211117 RepID=A0A399JCY6_9RHOB|nr:universal stress protein [Pseudooceanicola sediminis]KAA2317153.1 universal stress protein [Puniceibacterium sp. HSS470]RII40496.1 universal stress protein [Pseudooceanicola sediminis]|tara:strand:+ start:90765 stop:91178 length:414 start_codon:yes stop_codon:yes gene_type:complete
MYDRIAVPVDLAHPDRSEKALKSAAALSRSFSADVIVVGVTSALGSEVAGDPKEFANRLAEFANERSGALGLDLRSHVVISHEMEVEVDQELLRAIEETGADLIVMASHAPKLTDLLWPSNGGRVASHARISVMLVR